MDVAYLSSLLAFAFGMSITPGPNNLMLTASGVNFGYLRTLPHLFGVIFGFLSMCVAVALGLGAIFIEWPAAHASLKLVGSAYLLWLAWKIAASGRGAEAAARARPLTFWQAAAFQAVNPKAWTMAITGISAFTLEGELLAPSAAAVVLAFALVAYPCCTFWTLLGTQARRFLDNDFALQLFNVSLGLLTASCVIIILR